NELLPVKLESERLRFRLIELSDEQQWNVFIVDDTVKEFLKIDTTDKEASKKWILNQHRRYNSDLGGLLAIENKTTNKFIGQAGILVQEINEVSELEIGYHLMPEERKKGYATEAAHALMNYIFENNIKDRIISLIHIENIASQKVAENNGLKRLSQMTFHSFPIYVYGISKKEFFLQKN
ncbi:MAG: GNAT family N-acetyltransferase, partial [Bacteroidia bacterium]|nr:GNAT family N-acetyltransferase [Bacteroidia bacterium]